MKVWQPIPGIWEPYNHILPAMYCMTQSLEQGSILMIVSTGSFLFQCTLYTYSIRLVNCFHTLYIPGMIVLIPIGGRYILGLIVWCLMSRTDRHIVGWLSCDNTPGRCNTQYAYDWVCVDARRMMVTLWYLYAPLAAIKIPLNRV